MTKEIEILQEHKSLISIKRNSILVSLMLGYNLILAVLDTNVSLSFSFGNVFALVIVSLVLFFSILNNDFTLRISSMLFLSFIFFIMFISMIFMNYYEGTIQHFVNFIFFGAISFLIGSKRIDTQLICKYVIYISLFSLPFISDLLTNHLIDSTYKRIDMGLSYALLPLVIATMVHLLYYRKQSNLIVKIGYLYNGFLAYLLIFMGTRGVFISIFLFLWFLLLNRYQNKHINANKVIHKRKWLFFSVFIVILLYGFFEEFLLIIYNITNELGFNVALIEKTYYLLKNEGDILNSRTWLFVEAYKGIVESPIWGNGIGSFKLNTGITYPHNFILDLLYEGGVVLAIPIIITVFYGLIKVVFGRIESKEHYLLLVILICASLPRLMVSASIWKNQIFWLLLAYIITKIPMTKKGYDKI